MLADFAAFWNTLDQGLTLLEPRHRETLLPMVARGQHEELKLRVANLISNRAYFISAGWYIGLAPAGLHQGDYIVILHGGKVPFVLRTGKDECADVDERKLGTQQSDSIVFEFSGPDGGINCYTVPPDPFDEDDMRVDCEGKGSGEGELRLESWFEFLGERYVHGFMEGEAFQTEHAGRFETCCFEAR